MLKGLDYDAAGLNDETAPKLAIDRGQQLFAQCIAPDPNEGSFRYQLGGVT